MAHVMGERLMLREYREDDFESIRRWVNDPETTRYLSQIFIRPHTALGTEKFLQGILSGQSSGYNFVIADRQTQEYCGQIDIFHVDEISRCGEIGLVIAPWVWRRGYAREALGLIERLSLIHISRMDFHFLRFLIGMHVHMHAPVVHQPFDDRNHLVDLVPAAGSLFPVIHTPALRLIPRLWKARPDQFHPRRANRPCPARPE